jgi:hypothetical protein
VFVRFPITRDVPWTMILMFAAGIGSLVHAVRHSRGKVAAPVALGIAILLAGFLSYAFTIGARDLPASSQAPRVGERAPDFTLPDQDGNPVSLEELLAQPGGVVLVFYRGHW